MGRRQNEAIARALDAPVGGWNAKDSLDSMKENQAVDLVNWFPSTDSVIGRRGFRTYSTGLAGEVETVAEFESGNINQLIAGAGGSLYNSTVLGPAVSLKAGFVNNQWQHVNFDSKLGLVNGTDLPQQWDGASLIDMVISGAGLTVNDLIDNQVYKSRVYYVEKDTQDFWYSPINTMGGVLTKFPLSRVGQFGGSLIAIGTWTRDSGDGADDWIFFVMSSGEIIVYTGDPASTFALVGVFRAGEPLSTRCILKFGANSWIMTRQGLLDLQKIMTYGKTEYDQAITDNIKNAYTKQTQLFGPRFGWDVVFYPAASMVVLNIPVAVDEYQQYVVNTETGAWCRFTGQNAFSWSLYDEKLFYGGDGVIYQADYGLSDDGELIEFDATTAYTYLGTRKRKKQVTMVQPVLKLNGKLGNNATVGVDMVLPVKPQECAVTGQAGTPWGSPWGSPWNGEKATKGAYTGLSGWGYNMALRLNICADDQRPQWYSTRWVFKPGGLV